MGIVAVVDKTCLDEIVGIPEDRFGAADMALAVLHGGARGTIAVGMALAVLHGGAGETISVGMALAVLHGEVG